MEATQVGKRYAKALYSLAQDEDSVDAVADDLEQLLGLLESSEDFASFCDNPLIASEERNKVFDSLFASSAHARTLGFLTFLDRKDRLASLGSICISFGEFYRSVKGILRAEVIFSHEPTSAQVDALQQKLAAKTGKTIEMKTGIDAVLIGGFRINIANEISDYSVASKLEQFRINAINA